MKIDTGMLATMSDLYLKIGATGLIKSTRLESIKDSPEAEESDKQPIKLSLSCTTVKAVRIWIVKNLLKIIHLKVRMKVLSLANL